MADVLDYFPEYPGAKVIPVFASLYLRDELIAQLSRRRIYALAMSGETMSVLNLDTF